MIYGPLRFRDYVSMFWFMLTSPAESKQVFGDPLGQKYPPLPARNPSLPLPPLPRQHPLVRDVDLAELMNSIRPETDPWAAMQKSFSEFEEVEAMVKRGEVPAPSSDYYAVKLRFLKLMFDRVRPPLH